MITTRKLKSLKERTAIRKIAFIFQKASTGGVDKDYLSDVFSYLLTMNSIDEKDKLKALFKKEDSLSYKDISFSLLSSLGDVRADWDIMGENEELDFSKRKVEERFLFLDHIRSPYNIGSLFRSAESFCVRKIYLSPGSASPEHKRAERTSMGTVKGVSWEEAEISDLPDIPIFALEKGGIPINRFSFPREGLCVIGGEEDGVSEEAMKKARSSLGVVSIDTFGAKGSINVTAAASILLYAWHASLS